MLEQAAFFTKQLLAWYAQSHRPLPWKGERNPYFIWLSEIILQQTRTEQGLPYFEKFKAQFPTVHDLAHAPEDRVMRLWQGLGYYSRARNLHTAAKQIVTEYEGVFPNTAQELSKIKGIGTYTAAAIASFAFDEPNAVLDGNVYRVLARFFGIKTPIDTTISKRAFQELAQSLLDISQPARYNQAIMDFGATHCKPQQPLCKTCFLREKCWAFENNMSHQLPFKQKKIKKQTRFFHYLVFKFSDGTSFLHKRMQKDIWQNLYEFPCIENEHLEDWHLLKEQTWLKDLDHLERAEITTSKTYTQQLTHQTIHAVFFEICLPNDAVPELPAQKIALADINKFALPRIIDCYLQEKNILLSLFSK